MCVCAAAVHLRLSLSLSLLMFIVFVLISRFVAIVVAVMALLWFMILRDFVLFQTKHIRVRTYDGRLGFCAEVVFPKISELVDFYRSHELSRSIHTALIRPYSYLGSAT